MRTWRQKWLPIKTDHHPKLEELAAALQHFCCGVLADPINGKMLVLFGENGTGKTCSTRMVSRWIQKVGPSNKYVDRDDNVRFVDGVFWSWPELLDAFKNGGWDIVESLFGATVLILDELGGGHDPTLVGVDKLCQVLSKREKKWTIVTTNILPENWQEKFDRRIASRLNAAQWIDLSKVPDYRAVLGQVA